MPEIRRGILLHRHDMSRELDALTSSTLKHLREHWWNDAFTGFLEETLRPRPGKRILDVGCGTGTAEISLSRLRLSSARAEPVPADLHGGVALRMFRDDRGNPVSPHS